MAYVVVEVKDNEFDPTEVTIEPGDTVLWINKGSNWHTVTSTTDLDFGIGRLDPGRFYDFTFPADVGDGDFGYRCTRHPPGMSGEVTVVSAS